MKRGTETRRSRVDKGLRAGRKGVFHVLAQGTPQKFDDKTRENLERALARVIPSSSPKSVNRMIAAAERVVTNLSIARNSEANAKSTLQAESVRKLMESATEFRKISAEFFKNSQLRT